MILLSRVYTVFPVATAATLQTTVFSTDYQETWDKQLYHTMITVDAEANFALELKLNDEQSALNQPK